MDGGFEPQVSIDDDHSHQKVNSLTDMESGNFGFDFIRVLLDMNVLSIYFSANQVSFAPCATPNKMFSNTVSSVGFAWETIFAPNASSLTMMFQRNSIIVTDVIFAGCCYSKAMKDSHNCVDKAMHHNCRVCFEFLFDTREDITVLRCGHNIHLECVKEMERHYQYSCPVCSKSFRNMSRVWEKLDEEVAGTPMPQKYQNKMVWILCNDCGETSQVNFHIVAHKCLKCKSYNTRKTRRASVILV
ncbi:unnamed protein product [Malus baccata var. baccata]